MSHIFIILIVSCIAYSTGYFFGKRSNKPKETCQEESTYDTFLRRFTENPYDFYFVINSIERSSSGEYRDWRVIYIEVFQKGEYKFGFNLRGDITGYRINNKRTNPILKAADLLKQNVQVHNAPMLHLVQIMKQKKQQEALLQECLIVGKKTKDFAEAELNSQGITHLE